MLQLSNTAQRLNTLMELTRSIASTLDLATLLNRLMEQLVTIIPGANVGAIYIYDLQTRRLIPAACAGVDSEVFRRLRLLPGESISGKVFQTGQPALAQTLAEADALRGPLGPENERLFAQARGDRSIRSNMCVPLRTSAEQVIGTLTLGSTLRAFCRDDLTLLEAVATQAAIAIDNARLFEQVVSGRERLRALSQRLIEVQEAECRRISRELHDEIGQTLTGLKLLLQAAARAPAEAAGQLAEGQAMLTELAVSLRNLSLELRPTVLDHLGLLPALLGLFERCGKQMGVQVDFEHSEVEGRRFPAQLETAVYRILQEALTNVARHAGVDRVSVRLWADGATLRAVVTDQGKGFELGGVSPELAGVCTGGLSGMRERANLLDGYLTVESRPGAGTRLLVEFPVGVPGNEEADRAPHWIGR